ncbi:hypothetical protein [Pasteurella multocida]|uniref:hypothetical protein n=1 Tax=Pasteurella multocida TaxID=747 RepID=UPI000FDC2325|nr:hypothetical protein [Pasteurella multocida]
MMKGFDLQRALAGEPVRLRNGCKAFVLHRLSSEEIYILDDNLYPPYELVGYRLADDGQFDGAHCWTLNGQSYEETSGDVEECFEIVGMWNTYNTVRVELPQPLDDVELNQRVYFITAKGISSVVYKETANDLLMLEDARFFATREDAQAWEDLAKRVRDM